MGYDKVFLHSFSTEAGMSFSVVAASLSISSIALSISYLENSMSAIFGLEQLMSALGRILSCLLGSLNTDSYCFCRMFAISGGLLVSESLLYRCRGVQH